MDGTPMPLKLIAFGLMIAVAQSAGAAEATLASRADDAAREFRADPGGYDALFAPSFLAAVPAEQLTPILQRCFGQLGRCTAIRPAEASGAYEGKFQFEFEKGFHAEVSLAVDAAPPHLITGFFIGPPAVSARTLDDVIAQFKSLPGTNSLYVGAISDAGVKPIAQLNSDQPLAIGSAFKLYVLAELVRELDAGERHWTDVIGLDEASRSLPSGFLEKWPAGSPLTLHTLAGLMISQSDNTAADQLIHTLGREKVEGILADAGISDPRRDVPFLTTLELFKLKSDAGGKLIGDFLAASTTDRRKLLDGPVAAMQRDAIESYATPRHVADVEWFASTADLGRVMRWLLLHTADAHAADARGILAINPGLGFPEGRWKYVGYKGGSEPGVINMTFLLQSNDKQWLTVSATWNNADKAVDETRFAALVQQAVELSR
jgi:beta-lactamase class A